MRVAVVTQYFPTSLQPWAGHSAYQTLRLLAKRCELKVFYPEAHYLAGKGSTSRIDPAYRPPDVDVEYIPYPALPLVSRPLNGWSASRRLLPYVRRFDPGILLNYVAYPDGFAAVRIGGTLHKPVVLTAIGSDLNRMSDPVCAALTKSALRDADFTVTVSGDLLNTARKLGASPTASAAILNGCDTEIFRPQALDAAREALSLPMDAKIVTYVGRYDLRKGLIELIDAAARVKQQTPGLRCYLVGDGPDKPLLQEAIGKHNADEWITLVPPQPTREVALWMAASDLVTLPSYKEGCPNVVIEALCAGRPVVATDVGGIPELMDSASGRLVPAMDVEALALALQQTLDQHWSAEEIASRHTRSWQDVATDVLQVLEQTLNNFKKPGRA
jgi:teichuronic acid biosynthesis glycosyltransferase TuaC